MKGEPTDRIEDFQGVNNQGNALRLSTNVMTDANNIDIDDGGALRLRDGLSDISGLSGFTDLHARRDETRAFGVVGGALAEIHGDGYQELYPSIGDSEVRMLELADQNLFSTDIDSALVKGKQSIKFTIPMPSSPVVEERDGDLPEGLYRFAVVYEDALIRHGPCSQVVTLDLPASSGVRLTVNPPTGYMAWVYATGPNETELRRAGLPVSGGLDNTIDILGMHDLHADSLDDEQLGSYPTPTSSQPMAFYEGRLYVAQYEQLMDATAIYFSKPYWYHLCDIARDFFMVPGRVRLLAGFKGQGLLIGTDRGIHFRSIEGNLSDVTEYGVVPGTSNHVWIDEGSTLLFMTGRGLCRAMPFENLTRNQYVVGVGDECAVSHIEHNGIEKALVLLAGERQSANNSI